MTTVLLGYVIISNRVIRDECSVGYLYREVPDGPLDSGWRVFSGDETPEYANDPSNFAMYNASTLIERAPAVQSLLGEIAPCAFERHPGHVGYVHVELPDTES